MDKESATITFNSGRVSTLGSSYLEFKGIPLKDILGDMWDKYKKFKLVLNTHAGNFNTGYFNKEFIIRISGLPFINTTDYKIFNNASRCLYYPLPSKSTTMFNLNQFVANNGGTFLKPSNHNVDITISFIDRGLNQAGATLGFNIFTFSIYGVEE